MIHLGFLKLRILMIFFLGAFFFLFIIGRALQLQLIPNQKLAHLAKSQYRTAVTLFPKRGTIYDRKMNELAVSRKVGSVFANPPQIVSPKRVSLRLSQLTGVNASKIYKKLRSKKSFVWIKRLVDDKITDDLQKNPIEGVGLLYEYKRFYPNQELAGQVLGVVGVDSQGIEGVEYSYNDVLFGKTKSVALIRDAHGRPVTFDKTLFMESQEGTSLILSIDASLQFLIEKELGAFVDNFQAKRGIALVQEVKTGEILAIANVPSFNPNHPLSYSNDHWKNKAVIESFEPGSIFKIFLAALALEKGISPSESFFCENGFYEVTKKAAIREAQNHKFQWLSFQDILKFSSNIGAAKMGARVGKRAFYQKISEFGFGGKTNVGLAGEMTGILRPVQAWTVVDLSNIAFGQGISVTPLQLIAAISAIANDGILMKPMLVKKKSDPKTTDMIDLPPEKIRQVISPEISRQLTKMLVRVTQPDGTGYLASLTDTAVAGKTGTAQKPNLENGGYWQDKYISSFIGFFPANEPHYSIFVMLDEPKKIYYASQVAAPLFKVAALHTLQMYPVRPTQVSRVEPTPQNTSFAKKQFKKSEEALIHQELDRMPDLQGKSMREVLEFSSQSGLVLKVKGSGIAIHQSLEEGSLIQPGQECIVTFRALSN